MTRLDLLKILVGRARSNGFEFRRWYTTRLGLPWISPEAALTLLETQRRYYALLFAHEFAEAFWKAGEQITFEVPAQVFQRTLPDGSVGTVSRKPFTRRSARRDAWKYHLREMALAPEPLRYMRKYLAVEEDLDDESQPDVLPSLEATAVAEAVPPAVAKRAKRQPKPLPKELPAFLRRPFP